jgi:glyoxylase-like metal-dependent hydrolase (beta-lactamase superfamily II)
MHAPHHEPEAPLVVAHTDEHRRELARRVFDTGAAPNAREVWPPIVFELFAITEYRDEQRLDNVLGAAGFGLDDVKAIVLSHMHLDHAGGLEFFRGKDVPVYVSATELRNAFYAIASKEDIERHRGQVNMSGRCVLLVGWSLVLHAPSSSHRRRAPRHLV